MRLLHFSNTDTEPVGEDPARWTAAIRAVFLDRIRAAYENNPELPTLLVDEEFGKDLAEADQAAYRVSPYLRTRRKRHVRGAQRTSERDIRQIRVFVHACLPNAGGQNDMALTCGLAALVGWGTAVVVLPSSTVTCHSFRVGDADRAPGCVTDKIHSFVPA